MVVLSGATVIQSWISTALLTVPTEVEVSKAKTGDKSSPHGGCRKGRMLCARACSDIQWLGNRRPHRLKAIT